MTTPRFSHDIPTRIPGMRRVAIRAYLGNGAYLVWDGAVQTAHAPGLKPFKVGKNVMAQWDSAAGTYILPSNDADPPRSIELFKVWQLSDVDNHNFIDMHPEQPWIATVRNDATLEVWDWETETMLSSIALATNNNVDVKWCPLGCHLAVAAQTTPYIHVYPVNTTTAYIDPAVPDPASAPGGEPDSVVWHPDHISVYINRVGGGADPVSGWPFVTSFGTRFSNPGEVAGWGSQSLGYGAGLFSTLGLYTPEPAIVVIRGLSIVPDGSALVMVAGDGAVNWLTAYQIDLGGRFESRYDSLYTLHYGTNDSGPSPAWLDFDDDGEVVLWGNVNGTNYNLDSRGAPAYACEWEQAAFGPLIGMPYGPHIANGNDGSILAASRGPKWRPGTRHVVIPTYTENEEAGGDRIAGDPLLSLFVMEAARFGYRLDWPNPEPDDWDWGVTTNLYSGMLRVAWSQDGRYLLVGLGGSRNGGLTDSIAVFKVT